tara:strand:+ start:6772 stop:7644 length:873 start_codon:yes stop_codon:yes gene_type:complete
MKRITLFLMLIAKISFAQIILENCTKAKDKSRIVCAGGSITEIIYLLGEEKKIVAIDVTSVYPENVNKKPSIGYVRNLSSEGILSMSPTLILGEDDMGPPNIIKQLESLKLDVRVIKEKQNTEGIIDKILCIGKILNIENKCKKIIDEKIYPSVKELHRISSIKEMKEKKVMLVLSMKGSSPIVAGNNTSGNSYIKMLGAKNIYDSIEGWQTVSEESIIELNPDFIILPQKELHKNSNVNTLTTKKIFSNTNAGKKNNFIYDDGMAILGFGPRTIFSAIKTAEIISKDLK